MKILGSMSISGKADAARSKSMPSPPVGLCTEVEKVYLLLLKESRS